MRREVEPMSDFETFDAARIEELAAEGEWVLVVLLDDSDVSHEWEEMLEHKAVSNLLDNYSSFLLGLEASPQEASEAMENWEVDQLPALVILDEACKPFDAAYLAADSVEGPEDFVQYLEDHAASLDEEDEDDWEENDDLED